MNQGLLFACWKKNVPITISRLVFQQAIGRHHILDRYWACQSCCKWAKMWVPFYHCRLDLFVCQHSDVKWMALETLAAFRRQNERYFKGKPNLTVRIYHLGEWFELGWGVNREREREWGKMRESERGKGWQWIKMWIENVLLCTYVWMEREIGKRRWHEIERLICWHDDN